MPRPPGPTSSTQRRERYYAVLLRMQHRCRESGHNFCTVMTTLIAQWLGEPAPVLAPCGNENNRAGRDRHPGRPRRHLKPHSTRPRPVIDLHTGIHYRSIHFAATDLALNHHHCRESLGKGIPVQGTAHRFIYETLPPDRDTAAATGKDSTMNAEHCPRGQSSEVREKAGNAAPNSELCTLSNPHRIGPDIQPPTIDPPSEVDHLAPRRLDQELIPTRKLNKERLELSRSNKLAHYHTHKRKKEPAAS